MVLTLVKKMLHVRSVTSNGPEHAYTWDTANTLETAEEQKLTSS